LYIFARYPRKQFQISEITFRNLKTFIDIQHTSRLCRLVWISKRIILDIQNNTVDWLYSDIQLWISGNQINANSAWVASVIIIFQFFQIYHSYSGYLDNNLWYLKKVFWIFIILYIFQVSKKTISYMKN